MANTRKTVPISITIEAHLEEALEELSIETGISKSKLINDMVKGYICMSDILSATEH